MQLPTNGRIFTFCFLLVHITCMMLFFLDLNLIDWIFMFDLIIYRAIVQSHICLVTKYMYYSGTIMSAVESQITCVSIVYSIVCSSADQRKHQSSASLAFVRGLHRWPVDSPHKSQHVSIWWRHHGGFGLGHQEFPVTAIHNGDFFYWENHTGGSCPEAILVKIRIFNAHRYCSRYHFSDYGVGVWWWWLVGGWVVCGGRRGWRFLLTCIAKLQPISFCVDYTYMPQPEQQWS